MLGQVSLDFSCPRGTWVKADREKIREIFYNLISNALRFTPRDGTIAITATPQKDKVDISVSDTGRGIPEAEQHKVFKKFTQIKGERKGTGIGLYIVKSIVEAHNSAIKFKSTPGEGTTFFFSLEKGTPPEGKPPGRGLVFLVSENESTSHIVIEALKEEGYPVEFFTSGKKAFDNIARQKPSLLIIYRTLPDFEVDKFQAFLASNPESRHLPIILISTLGLDEWQGKFSAVIPIPLNTQLLKETLKKVA